MKNLILSIDKLGWRLRKTVQLALLCFVIAGVYMFLKVSFISASDQPFSTYRTFGPNTDLTSNVAVGDWNNDGFLDLIVGNNAHQDSNSGQRYGGSEKIYLNDGKGNFYTGPVACGSTPGVLCFSWWNEDQDYTSSVAVGDLNNDGNLELVAGNNPFRYNPYTGWIGWSYAGGNVFGTFTTSISSMALGDINGDSFIDIVTTGIVYLNNGNGEFYFQPTNNPPDCNDTRLRCFGGGSNNSLKVSLGYIDGNGSLDIVVGNNGGQNVVYLNDGSGNFYQGTLDCTDTSRMRCFGTGTDPTTDVAVGDMNGDGYFDIVAVNYNGQSIVYLNDGSGNFYNGSVTCGVTVGVLCYGTPANPGSRIATGDLDGDGDLDLAVASHGGQNYAYLNDGTGNFNYEVVSCDSTLKVLCFGTGNDPSTSIAIGDLDGDGALDIVVGNDSSQSVVYLNNGAGIYPFGRSFGDGTAQVRAVGDMNGDSMLDLVTSERTYLNDGTGGFHSGSVTCGITPSVRCNGGWTVGDMNGDGALDIVASDRVFLNDGGGNFNTSTLFTPGGGPTSTILVSDMDSDGDLDILVGQCETSSVSGGPQSAIFLNNGTGGFHSGLFPTCGSNPDVICFGSTSEHIMSIAVGDLDRDGDLDFVVVGPAFYFYGCNCVRGAVAKVYINNGTGNFDARIFGTGSGARVALGDVNGDGALDIVVGDNNKNYVYMNDGAANFYTGAVVCGVTPGVRCFGIGSTIATDVKLGDMDDDGDIDIILANNGYQSAVYLNDGAGNFNFGLIGLSCGFSSRVRCFGPSSGTTSVVVGDLNRDGDLDITISGSIYSNNSVGPALFMTNPPWISLVRPGPTRDADFYSTPAILGTSTIPVTYKLFDRESDPVRFVRAYYSLDGGGSWSPAIATSSTITTNLATSSSGITYVYTWDTYSSGFFGQSDNVVFRLVAVPDVRSKPNSVPGPFMYGSYASQTFPFRVRGTQMRVMNGASGAANTLVYRLPTGQSGKLTPIISTAGQPFRTDSQGYLQGRGELKIGDQLVALAPTITYTKNYTLYYTSLPITATVPMPPPVRASGVQTSTVSSANALVLLNLDVSLEWDARKDTQFLSQLDYDLKRASELLYDWSNGQVAIGNVTIRHDKENWRTANIRIFASNRLRPNATQGGIVTQLTTDPDKPEIQYHPGHVNMPAKWNRYGNASGTLGEDWPRALAHELGHYALFLDDNYLGLDTNGLLIALETCTNTAMTDPYRDDYSEFHFATGWTPDCASTLSQKTAGRSDWATIKKFYNQLNNTATNSGPSILPLAVTQPNVVEPVTSTQTIDVPTYFLIYPDGTRIQPGNSARSILFQGDRLIDLGRPTLDQVTARGARPGDQLCVYALESSDPRVGCTYVSLGVTPIALSPQLSWTPAITVTPVTSRTITVNVGSVPSGLSLNARLFPASASATINKPLAWTGSQYSVTFTSTDLPVPAFQGYVRVWVEQGGRDIVTEYAMGGGSSVMWDDGSVMWDDGSVMWDDGAPGGSADGQANLFMSSNNFTQDQFVTFQSASVVPSVPAGLTVIGHAYRLSTSASVPNLSGASISFRFMGSEVPSQEKPGLRIYFWNGTSWQPLDTKRHDYYNVASAFAPGTGLYALMSTVEIPLYGPGWNLVAYPIQATQPVTQALMSIDPYYTMVYGYVVTDTVDPWKVYAKGVPSAINDLTQLEFGRGYWITVTQNITLALSTRTSQPTQPRNMQLPPSTFYGPVRAGTGFTPTVGMTVTASIVGNPCGQGRTLYIGGQVYYAIDVFAKDVGNYAACGELGRPITFKVGTRAIPTVGIWNNNRLQYLPLGDGTNLYFFPYIRKSP